MVDTTYIGTGNFKRCEFEVCACNGGTSIPLPPRNDLRNHSPDGLSWGYSGSGPAQLALALLADATGNDELALKYYQQFKFERIANLPENWQMPIGAISSWVRQKERADA